MESLEKSSKLLRNELGSIDLSDIEELEEEKLNPKDAMSRSIDTELFYKNIFEKVIKLFIQKQLEFMGKEAENEAQFLVGRGTINGLCLVRDWFEDEKKAALSRHEPKEEIKGPFPEI